MYIYIYIYRHKKSTSHLGKLLQLCSYMTRLKI